MIKFAVDLLWVKHNQIGGVESYVRNLLDGMLKIQEDFNIYLLVSKDNYGSFKHYGEDVRCSLIRCNVDSNSSSKSILWINLHLDKLLSEIDIDFCFVPNSRKPLFSSKKHKYVCTIHDLQALHFPEYFSRIRAAYLRLNWYFLVKSSYKLIAISEYVKKDILEQYRIDETKVAVIYNPISSLDNAEPFSQIAEKYGIQKYGYYYTVSSLLRHKNTLTLLKMMNVLVNERKVKDIKLLISGIKGDHFNYLEKYIKSNNLGEYCVFTGFVSNSERNALMKYSEYFLFPSIFEGFGMPVIEALRLGTKVITTKCASLEEVSESKAIYVDNPFDENEWIQKINKNKDTIRQQYPFEKYNFENIAKQYIDLFKTICSQSNIQ